MSRGALVDRAGCRHKLNPKATVGLDQVADIYAEVCHAILDRLEALEAQGSAQTPRAPEAEARGEAGQVAGDEAEEIAFRLFADALHDFDESEPFDRPKYGQRIRNYAADELDAIATRMRIGPLVQAHYRSGVDAVCFALEKRAAELRNK